VVRLLRVLIMVVLGATVVAAAGTVSRAAGIAALTGVAVSLAILFVFVPRMAHDAFESGRFGRASILYRVLRVYVLDPRTRAAIDVSLAGCRLADGAWQAALDELAGVDPDKLGPSARAAFYNNRAYARARGKLDAQAALADVDRATELRPDVAGFRHTRGLALLAAGRLDDAIAELDAMWRRMGADEAPPLLEAERCFDLGVAWQQKGEPEYARDYFQRARAVAPASPWAAQAAAALRKLPRAHVDDEMRAAIE
jgi:tetratricopeptide (TPR) repeat protein